LDFLYGLLDGDELGEMRAHLDGCPPCQAALKLAQEQQRLFSQAARVCEAVKPFAAPDFDAPLAEPAPVIAAAAAIQPALPMQPQANGTAPPAKVRVPRWMTFSAVVLAASVLLAILIGETYSTGLTYRESQLSQAKSTVQTTEVLFAKAQKACEEQLKSLPGDQARDVLHLQVSAPAQYHPQAPSSCTVQTAGLSGEARRARVVVQVLDKAGKQLARQEADCDGLQTVQLPPGLAADDNQVFFEVSALAESATAKVEAKLRQSEPTLVTHLATNKTAYRIGDLLFFRTVTLENFSLKPAAKAIPLRFSLVSLDGKVVKQLPVTQTAAGGISGGEFALTADIPNGIYSLEVAAGAGNGVGPVLQRRRLEIISDDTPQIVLNGKKYYPGDNVPFDLVERQKSGPVAKAAVTIQSLAPQAAGPAAPMQNTVTDDKGRGNLKLSANLNSTRAPYEFRVNDGKNNRSIIQSVPVIPSKITVDFYPEGGELVDGLPARIYYRVTSLDGEPIFPRGKMIFRSSKGVLYESPAGQATGVFTFTPSIVESYAVRIDDPQFEVVQTDPIEKLGVQANGLTLSIPTGVSHDGEPIRVLLANKGESKRIVVMVSCRGQIVQHEAVQVGEGKTELKLNAPAGIAGVLRVSAYQAGPQGLLPLAERLVFRMPSQKLDLAVTTQGGRLGNVARGQKAQLEIKGVNEKQQPTGYFALAYVVDAKVKTDKECDLPTHFFLAGDVPNDDLEQAQIVVRDDQASRQALDLFLGAQPWRRLPDAGPESNIAQLAQLRDEVAKAEGGAAKKLQDRGLAAAVVPVLLSLENAGLSQLQAQYETRLAKSLSTARNDFLDLKNGLASKQDAQKAHYQAVAADLAEYRQLPQNYLRQAMSIVVLLCLVLGGSLLLFGVVAVLRQRRATMALGGSFAAFGLCMVLYLTARQVSVEIAGTPAPADLDIRPWKRLSPQGPALALAQAPKMDATMLPPGQYSLAPIQNVDRQQVREQLTAKLEKEQAAFPKAGVDALSVAKLTEASNNNQVGGGGYFGQAQERRFAEAKSFQENYAPTAPVPQPVPPPGAAGTKDPGVHPKGVAKKGDSAKDALADKLKKADHDLQNALNLQNSPYIWPRQGQPDTIVWFPALVTENGVMSLNFPVPNLAATYRVIVHGHSADGRLGYFEGNLEVK